MEKTKMSDLPTELFIEIFEKLKSPEIFKMAEICWYWYGVTQYVACVKNTVVNITCGLKKSSSDLDVDFDFFLESFRKFQFKLEIAHYNVKYFQFTQKFAESITEIVFVGRWLYLPDEYVLPSLNVLIPHLIKLKNLRKLKLRFCRFAYKTCPSINSDSYLSNLTSLHIETFKMNCIPQCTHFLSLAPKLESLFVKMYGLDDEAILEYTQPVIQYLKNEAFTKSLREFSFYTANNVDMHTIKHLNLEKFVWGLTDESYVNVNDLDTFLTSQKNLKTLELTMDEPFLTQIIRICSLNTLEHLTFNCWGLTIDMWCNDNFEAVWQLKHLELTDACSHIFKSLTKNTKMQRLSLNYFQTNNISPITDEHIIDKFAFLSNLKSFKYRNPADSPHEIDFFVEGVLKHLTNLQELYLAESYCQNLDSYIHRRTDFIISVCNGPCRLYVEKYMNMRDTDSLDMIMRMRSSSAIICYGPCDFNLERLIRLPDGRCKKTDAEEINR